VKTVAVVPVKGLDQAKSRLSGRLSPEQRAAITLDMLAHVLDTVEQSGVVERIAVISPEVESLPLPAGVARIQQIQPGLNNLLEQGRQWTISENADAMMVIFADLPLLTVQDIAAIIRLGQNERTLVLAPDRHGRGTNVMLSHPPALARFAFGVDSYFKHRAYALRDGARVETYHSTGTCLDLDTPDDILYLESETLVSCGPTGESA
jgi:2-phospho-L-lactate guanylyltransferase